MPVGAFGGRRDIMQHIAPLGPVYQAGTLSGNPVAMAAGLANFDLITQAGFYDTLAKKVQRFTEGLEDVAQQANIPLTTNRVGGMFGFFFTKENPVSNFQQVSACDIERFRAFYHGMLEQGIYLAPSAYEAGFVSAAHTDADIDATLDAAGRVLKTF